MRNFKDIILEKLKISTKKFEWTKTNVPNLDLDTLVQFGKLLVEKLGDKTELPIADIYEYLDIAIPESVSYNILPSKGGKSYRRVKFVDYLHSIQCFKHENSKYNYIVGLNYENTGHHGWEPLTTTSFIDFIKILGNGDEITGHKVFNHVLKKIYYEAGE